MEEHYPERPVKVTRTGGQSKERHVWSFLNAGMGVAFTAHKPSIDATLRALYERVFLHAENGRFVPPHVPEEELFNERLRPFERRFDRFVRGLTPLTPDEFVASCDSRKRQVYQNAKESLEQVPLQPQDSHLKTFVKREKVNFTKKSDPAPRVIQPRDPRFNLRVGCYMRPLEGFLYSKIKKVFRSTTVFKGMNALQQGRLCHKKWSKFRDPVAVGLDARRFDQHVHVTALKWEHKQYCKCYDDPDHKATLRGLLRCQLVNTGRAWCDNGKLKYTVHGCRASGDMNTGCGNCLLMCAMVYSFMESVGLNDKYELMNNGDDCVLILERRDLNRLAGIEQWFAEMGFPLDLEAPVYALEHIEFCQTHPVFDGRDYVMVRDPHVCLDKDLVSIKPVRNVAEWNTLRNSVGLCGLALAGDMPIFSEFYEAVRRGAGDRIDRDATESGFKILARGMNKAGRPVADSARASFYLAFGITPDHQIALEQHYRSIVPKFADPEEVRFIPTHPRAMGCAY